VSVQFRPAMHSNAATAARRQVASVFEGRDDGGADGGQVGCRLPLGETAGTRAAQVAADAWLEETGVLRRTIGAGPTGSRSSQVC
jgi:hypothetical protein